jgi:hypothetical protein
MLKNEIAPLEDGVLPPMVEGHNHEVNHEGEEHKHGFLDGLLAKFNLHTHDTDSNLPGHEGHRHSFWDNLVAKVLAHCPGWVKERYYTGGPTNEQPSKNAAKYGAAFSYLVDLKTKAQATFTFIIEALSEVVYPGIEEMARNQKNGVRVGIVPFGIGGDIFKKAGVPMVNIAEGAASALEPVTWLRKPDGKAVAGLFVPQGGPPEKRAVLKEWADRMNAKIVDSPMLDYAIAAEDSMPTIALREGDFLADKMVTWLKGPDGAVPKLFTPDDRINPDKIKAYGLWASILGNKEGRPYHVMHTPISEYVKALPMPTRP